MLESKFWSSIIISLALIIAASIFGSFYYYAQLADSKDVLSVTGSTKTQVVSDQAKLVIVLSRIVNVNDLSAGYVAMAKDLQQLRDLLKKFDVKDVIESPISMDQFWGQNNDGITRYQLRQTITIQSSDVNKITEISKQIPTLASQGAMASVESLEYFYSQLPNLRISLLTQAVEDAKARAEKIAQGTGRKVGSVKEASIGVVQVMSPNSVDISDYGNYDTSSINKDVMVTVRVSFRLK